MRVHSAPDAIDCQLWPSAEYVNEMLVTCGALRCRLFPGQDQPVRLRRRRELSWGWSLGVLHPEGPGHIQRLTIAGYRRDDRVAAVGHGRRVPARPGRPGERVVR